MSRCEFCSIIRGESPAEVLFRDEHAIAILDIRPIHRGHVLVIPVRHSGDFLDVPAADCDGLFRALRVVTRGVVDAIRPPGFNVFSNNGKAAGQSVFHFHFHVTPRYHDDNIRFVLELKSYQPNEMSEYGRRIREAIAAPGAPGQPIKETL